MTLKQKTEQHLKLLGIGTSLQQAVGSSARIELKQKVVRQILNRMQRYRVIHRFEVHIPYLTPDKLAVLIYLKPKTKPFVLGTKI